MNSLQHFLWGRMYRVQVGEAWTAGQDEVPDSITHNFLLWTVLKLQIFALQIWKDQALTFSSRSRSLFCVWVVTNHLCPFFLWKLLSLFRCVIWKNDLIGSHLVTEQRNSCDSSCKIRAQKQTSKTGLQKWLGQKWSNCCKHNFPIHAWRWFGQLYFLGDLRWVARFGLKWAKSVRAKSKHLEAASSKSMCTAVLWSRWGLIWDLLGSFGSF